MTTLLPTTLQYINNNLQRLRRFNSNTPSPINSHLLNTELYNTPFNIRPSYPKIVLDESSPQIEQPTNISIQLFEHQRSIIYYMKKLEEEHIIKLSDDTILETNLGIISDKVGSGKTLDIITLITINKSPKRNRIFSGDKSSTFYTTYKTNTENIESYGNLIIVPHSLIKQWINCINYSDLNVLAIYKKKEFEETDYNKIKDYDIVLVSSTFIYKFTDKINRIFIDKKYNWKRIILDEPHTFAIPQRMTVNCDFAWLMCATPEDMILSSCKKILKYLLGSSTNIKTTFKLCIQNSDKFVDSSIKLPKVKKVYINCLTPVFLDNFRSFIPNTALSLLNAGCVDDAIKSLNCNVDTTDNIINSLTKYYEIRLHNLDIRINMINQLIISDEDKTERIAKIEEEKAPYIQKIEGIKERILAMQDTNCPICLEDFINPVVNNCCKNIFCMECILKCATTNSKCPFCRKKIETNKFHVISNKVPENDLDTKPQPTKEESLINILKNSTDGQKFIICSNHYKSFINIQSELIKHSIIFKMLKGSSNVLSKTINEYKNGDINVLLLDAENYGSGLNLEMTTDIIIYNNLGESLEKQVIGRGQRLGRKESLTVTYLQYNNEYKQTV